MHLSGEGVVDCHTVVGAVALQYSMFAGVHLWAAGLRACEHVTSSLWSLVLSGRRERLWIKCMSRPVLDGFIHHQILGLQAHDVGFTLLERDVESIRDVWTWMSSVGICKVIPRCIC